MWIDIMVSLAIVHAHPLVCYPLLCDRHCPIFDTRVCMSNSNSFEREHKDWRGKRASSETLIISRAGYAERRPGGSLFYIKIWLCEAKTLGTTNVRVPKWKRQLWKQHKRYKNGQRRVRRRSIDNDKHRYEELKSMIGLGK